MKARTVGADGLSEVRGYGTTLASLANENAKKRYRLMRDTHSLYEYSIKLLDSLSVKYKSHYFPSGVMMLDVWHGDEFCVLQFEDDFIGFSTIDSNSGFDTVPDEKYDSEEKFKQRLKILLK